MTRKFNWSCATYLCTFLQMQQDPLTINSLSLTIFIASSIWKSHTCGRSPMFCRTHKITTNLLSYRTGSLCPFLTIAVPF